jgi:hypothetical protein
VHTYVKVVERTSGAAVSGATVEGGPIGRGCPLVEESSAPGAYDGTVTGYESVWEFSVVRGNDFVRRVRLVGPSYPSIQPALALTTPGASVSWWPRQEPNVESGVCFTDEGPSHDPYTAHDSWCATGMDEGFASFPSSDSRQLPRQGFPYLLDLRLDKVMAVERCSGCGEGEVHLSVELELPSL